MLMRRRSSELSKGVETRQTSNCVISVLVSNGFPLPLVFTQLLQMSFLLAVHRSLLLCEKH